MGPKDKELLKKLLATFKVEAEEHVAAISSGLIELEKACSPEQQMEMVERVFREAHSLKGAARAVNLSKVESICQLLESLFSRLKTREVSLSPELFDQLHRTVDTLGVLLSDESTETATVNEPRPPQMQGTPNPPTKIILRVEPPVLHSVEVAGARPPISQLENTEPGRLGDTKQGLSETLRVPASKLDALLRQTEELIPAKATVGQRVVELREISQVLTAWETEWRKIRPLAHALPSLANGESRSNGRSHSSNGHAPARLHVMKLAAFLDRNEDTLNSVRQKLVALGKRLEYDRRAFERRVDDLVEDMKRVSMLPFSTLLESFPKLIRDLNRDCGKDADLTIVGGEIETDRRILEEMKDPLIHLIRNCIDHGIETPKQREERGKPPRATIRIAILPKSDDKVEIVVSDDGSGIDVRKVRAASVKLGLASEEDARKMDEQQAAGLIFRSGVSTSPMITEISGRGLGLAIVREKAEKVGGTVSVETQPGAGTTFRLILPLTLARFRGILVRASGSLFIVPTRHVQRVLRVSREEIKSAENRETIQIDGRAIAAVRLSDVLEIAQRNTGTDPKEKIPVLVLAWAGEQIGFLVDEILDEQEVLVKSLGKQLPHVRNIAGATVLGTGKVSPVLNVTDLIQSAVKTARAAAVCETKEFPKSILVAEDSITSRTLLKNILEFAGYKVKTAIDGAEALAVLGAEAFDLVVSDVEMPRMSGFDLTAKIRADKRLSQLPVVLVTGLDSRENRERGVDAGASAYIVKSSFDQGNLLEVVRRLI
ncbi:MAG: hybrid sensor histidine kinase/response regulator [Candidatus Sulfotelmatobacter sp.]